MKKTVCSFALASLLFTIARADEGFIIGATTSSGVIYSDKEHEAIAMNREIIDFMGFIQTHTNEFRPAALASYSVLFEFENTTGGYHQVDCGFPIQIAFTHFDPQSRASITEFLTKIFPDLFDLRGTKEEVLKRIQAQFESRVFIRRFVNMRDLYLLQTEVNITQDGKPVDIDRVMVEFRLVDDDRGGKKTVLSMQLHLLHKLNFTPRQKSIVIVRYYTPAFNMGYDSYNFYAPYVIGTGATWKGEIQAIYILNRPHESSLALPYYLDYTTHDFEYDKRLTIIKKHEPERFEKIGFFAVRNQICGCSKDAGLHESISMPWSLRNVSASSSLSATSIIQGACFETAHGTSVARWIPDFDMGYYDRLTIVREIVTTDSSLAHVLHEIAENQCSGDEALVEVKKAYHPLWAFDNGPDSISLRGIQQFAHFKEQTAWCEGVPGDGVGEYLSFQIIQPAKGMKLYPGNQRSQDVFFSTTRPKFIDLTDDAGNQIENLSLWDFMTSSSFDIELPAGRYRLVIRETYPGSKDKHTCISGIYFRFTIDDTWLVENYDKLKGVKKKEE